MILLEPKPFFDRAGALASLADNEWENLILPSKIISLFCKSWQICTGHKAIPANAQVRLYTSATNSEIVSHCDLAKAMATSPLYATLHKYREFAIKLADFHKIDTFRQEFREKRTSQPPSWALWSEAIRKTIDISDEEKTRFEKFLTDSDSFYGIKGIAREDFASPALCKSIDKRIDRFSICGDIAKTTITAPDLFSLVEAFLTKRTMSLGSSEKFTIPSSKEPLARNLCLSTLTKPFVILTGSSGTGKTKLAESVARYLGNLDSSNFKVVPVGADWTDNRHVLGFVNHLRDDGTDGKRPIYQTTDILDLLLEADRKENENTPYFLILDEMNLSHVERYFADFLSVMERSGGRISLHREGSGDNAESRLLRHPEDKLGVPQSIGYPKNLFVIGTVNIDETTYMFSPKVLDRANVIEFKVEEPAIKAFLENPSGYPEMERAADGMAQDFLKLSLRARTDGLGDLEGTMKDTLDRHLLEIFGIMEKGRYEFAYRTLNEVIRYLKVSHELAENKKAWIDGAWKADLDAQILQKILPKLHGSIGRISDLIVALADYCHRGVLPSEGVPGTTKLKEVAVLDATAAAFPQSFKKLQAMAATLHSEQFVSFIR